MMYQVKKKIRDPVAKDLRTPKYRMRVVVPKILYKRKAKHPKVENAILV